MEIMAIEAFLLGLLEKTVDFKQLVSIGVIYFLVNHKLKTKVAGHFISVEKSLASIVKNLADLKDSILQLEVKQTEQINNLGERVTRLENKGEKE
jgi:hypothetical protein